MPCSGGCTKGGQGRGRTADLTIFSRALYQLSYLTKTAGSIVVGRHRAGLSLLRGTPRVERASTADLTGFEPATFTLTG